MFIRAAGCSSAAAAAAAAAPHFLGQQGPSSNAADAPHGDGYDEQGRPASTSLPGVAFVNFRRRTVHAPGQFDDAGQAAADECMYLQPSAASATGSSAMQFGSSRAGSCGGSPCSRAATKNSLSIPAWASTPTWAPPGSPAGTAAHSTLACPAASTAVCPSMAGSSTPSTPASSKRHSKPKWLQNVLKYATPRAKSPRSKQLQQKEHEAMLLAQEQQQQQHYLQLQMQQQEEEQLQMQQQLAEQEEVAFQQQLYEHGWDELPGELQQQLREQFHEEFVLQLLQQEQLAHELAQLQAAYPDIDPATLQEQLMEQFQQAQEAQAQQQQHFQSAAGPADVYEQHQQYEHLQQQLAGLQLPEHVQSLIQQHQQQQQQQPNEEGAPALPLQSQEFVYAGPAAETQQGSDQQGGGPLVHVLDGPHGQVVQVTPDEFQDILTVMQALADARRDLAVRLQTLGGGQGTQGGTAGSTSGPAAAGPNTEGTASPLRISSRLVEPAAAYALAAGVDDNGPGYQVLQVHAGGTSASTGSQGYGAQQEDSDAQMLQDLNGPQVLLQDTGRSQSTGGRLEAASAAAAGAEKGGTLGVVGGWRASSGGRKAGRPNTASAVKPTLFDFTPADPVHAEVHYMRVADQEEFRIKARPATCQGFPALAKRNLQRSVAGSSDCSQPGKQQSAGAGRRPQSVLLGSPAACSSSPGTPLSASGTYLACAGSSTVAGGDDASSRGGRTSMVSTIGSTVGGGSSWTPAGAARACLASPERSPCCLDASDEAVRESAKVALQKYRAAFELMRLRDRSRSCSGWTDDDSPTKAKGAKQTPFSPLGTGGGADKSENETAIQLLTKKVAELEAGLSALLSGQAIPPAAAAALIAAISKMGVPSSQLIQALSKAGVKVSSLAGAAASWGGSRGPGSRNPSEGAALAAGDGKRAASNEAEAKPQGAAARQAAAELDSVIQAINQAQSQCESPAQQKRRQKQEGQGSTAQQPVEATSSPTPAAGSASDNTASPAAPAPPAAPSKAPQTSQADAKEAHAAPEPASVAGAGTAATACEQPVGAAAEALSNDQEDAQERQKSEKEDLKRATGAFDAAKFEAYSHKVTEDMARRAATNNYESDVKEEQQEQAERAAAAEAEAEGCSEEAAAALKVLAEAEKKLKELHEQEVRLKALWAEQEEWMSSYRQPAAANKASSASKTSGTSKEPQGGSSQGDAAISQPPMSAATNSDVQPKELAQAEAAADAAAARGLEAASQSAAAAAATAAAAAAAEAASSSSSARTDAKASSRSKAAAALSPEEQAIIAQRFVPTMSGEIPELAAVADAIVAGDIAAEESARMLGLMPPRAFDDGYAATAAGYMSDEGCKSTALPKHLQQRRSASSGGCTDGSSLGGSSGSEETEPGRGKGHKSIAAVKLEQDLELKAREQAARLNHRFAANPVPRSTRELRYHQLMAEQHAKRAATHQKYLQLLASQQQPFSFQQEEGEAAAAKAAKRAAAQDPNRFQRPFKAKPVPAHVHEAKYEAMMAAHEAAKTAAKVKAEMAKERVAKALEEDQARRSAAAASAYQERLGSSSIKPIKTKVTPRSSDGGSQKAGTPAAAAAAAATTSKAPEQSASGSSSSSAAGSPAPPTSSSQQPSKPQQHAHPFAQADAAGKELQAEFPVLHTTYSTDGGASGASEAGCSGALSSLHSQALGSEASGQLGKGGRERSGRKGSPGSSQQSPKRRSTPRGGGSGVPDFKAMHEKWEARQAAKKAANAKRVTVPEPPSFVTSSSEEEARAAERRSKVEADIKADEARLAEQRWPYSSPRAAPAKQPAPIKTRPSTSGLYGSSYASYTPSLESSSTAEAAGQQSDGGGCSSPLLSRPPKPLRGGQAAHRETAAALLRAQATKQAMLEGKFDTKEDKECKAQRAGEQEADEKARRAADAALRAAKKKEMMDERAKLLQQLHDMKAKDAATSPTRQRALTQQLLQQQESMRASSSPTSGSAGTAVGAASAASPAAQLAAAAAAAPVTSAAAASATAPAAPAQQLPAPAVSQAQGQAKAQAAATASETPAAELQAVSTPAAVASPAAAPLTGTSTGAGAGGGGALQAQQQQQQSSSGASMPTAAEVAAHLHKMLADDNARTAAASKEDQAAASRALAEGLAHSISNSASAASAASAAAAAASAAAAAAAAAAAGAAGAASCVAAASEQQQPLGMSRPASEVLAVEAHGMSYVVTSGVAAADRCLGAGDLSPSGCKVVPPVAAPAVSPLTGLSLSRSSSVTPSGADCAAKALVPSVLPCSGGRGSGAQQQQPAAGALGSRTSSAAGSCHVFASAEQAMELAAAALAADRPAGVRRGTGAGAGAGAATEPAVTGAAGAEAEAAVTSQKPGVAAAAAAASKGAPSAAAGEAAAQPAPAQNSRSAPSAAAGPASFALDDISTPRPASEDLHEEEQQQQQQQQQEEEDEETQQRRQQGDAPHAAAKGRQLKPAAAAAAEPEPELVQVPPSFLSVKDRINAINAAGRISPASSFNGTPTSGRELGVVEPELSGSYKPCHGWGRSMGCATAVFSNNAASRAHVSLIDQLRLSQVGTVVERSTVSSTTVVERRRAPIEGRQDAPLMHIEARHAQAEKRAKELVDEALRAHGVRKGYKEVMEEGEEQGDRGRGSSRS